MASGTTKHTLTPRDWTQIDAGDAYVSGKVISGKVHLWYGTSGPPALSADYVPFSPSDDEHDFSFAMGTGDELWAKAADEHPTDLRVIRGGASTSLPTGAATAANQASILAALASLDGPGSPSVDSYASAAVNLAASTANQELIAAPGADKQIWVYGLFGVADTAAGTIALQDEDDTALSGVMAVSDEGGFVLPPSGNFAMPWVKVATNKALEADTGACTFDGIITYAIVDVS